MSKVRRKTYLVFLTHYQQMNAIDESRVSLIIHDIKPPFLDSDVVLSKQIEMVSTVKDPNSAFARYAKAGSETLKEMIKDRIKKRRKK